MLNKFIDFVFKIFFVAFPIIFLLLTDYAKYGVNILTLIPLALYLLIIFC